MASCQLKVSETNRQIDLMVSLQDRSIHLNSPWIGL